MTLRDLINDTVPEGKPAEFLITVTPSPDFDKGEVKIGTAGETFEVGQKPPFVYWMMMAEYVLHVTALESGLPYDEALAKLLEGANKWRDV